MKRIITRLPFLFTISLLLFSVFTYGQGVFGGKIAVEDHNNVTTFFNTNSQTCDGAGTGNLSTGNATAYSAMLGDKYYLGGNVLTFGFNTNYGAFMQWQYYVVGGTAPGYGTALNFSGGTFTSGVCSSGTNIKIESLPNTSSSNYIQCTSIGNFRLDVLLAGYNNSTNYVQFQSGNYIPFNVSALTDPNTQSATIDAITVTTIDLNWVRDATPHNVMVVRSTNSSFTAPTQGNAYTDGTAIGSGTVVYNGAGTSFNDAGLTSGQIYYYKFYSENFSYYSPGVVTSGTTIPSISTSTISPTTFTAGASVTIPFTIALGSLGSMGGGNVYSALLSDASGSFTNAVAIGTLTSTSTSGTINISATIPEGIASTGTGYRIRVISSTPSITGSDNGGNLTINPITFTALDDASKNTFSNGTGNIIGSLGNWTISGAGGIFTGTSANNGNATATPNINTGSGTAWGIYTNGTSNNEDAYRSFSSPLTPGEIISFTMDNGFVTSGGEVGMRLQNTNSGQDLIKFSFFGGGSFYTLTDGTAATTTNIPLTYTGLTVVIAYTSANTYNVSITPKGSNILYYYESRTFSTQAAGQVPDIIHFFNYKAGSGSTFDFFVNSINITPTFNITYNGNSNAAGTVPSDANAYISGATVTALSNSGMLTRIGYTFAGWNTLANGIGTNYTAGTGTFAISVNTTLYAKWTGTINYNGNGNTAGTPPTDASSPYVAGATVTVLTNSGSLAKTGYTFAGWNTASNGSGTSYAATGSITFTMTGNITLYAQWTINSYSITYNGNGNTGGTAPIDGSSPYNYNSTITVLGVGTLVKSGYLFNGWNTASNGSGTTYNGGDNFTLGATNVVLYAQWAINTATADYRSQADGNLSVGSNWQYFNGSTWATASLKPTSTNNVTILNNITFDQDYTNGGGKNFTISSGSLTVAAGKTLTIAGTADFGNLSVTFKSNASGTAALGQITGTLTNDSNVTVERYIPIDNNIRAWRILGVPTYGSETIHATWQEGSVTPQDNLNPGYGTIITTDNASNYTSGGFDTYILPYVNGFTGGTSMQIFDVTNPTYWVDISSTFSKINNNTPVSNSITPTAGSPAAYALYIRGDRSILPSSSTSTSAVTTLRTNGTLYQGPLTVNLPAATFNLVGNPYASQIDFTKISSFANVNSNIFYVWDPRLNLSSTLGAYQYFENLPGWITFPGGGNYPVSGTTTIESGQAFLVLNTAPASPSSITFNENSKAANNVDVFRPASPVTTGYQLRTNLYGVAGSTALLADANLVVFNSDFSNAFNSSDALKLSNGGENFGLQLEGNILEIEARQPVSTADTVFFYMWNMKQQPYQLQFVPTNLNIAGMTAYLQDNYLGTSTPIDLANVNSVNFTVDANAGSSATDRFRIVFNNSNPVPVTFTNIQASQKNAAVAVNWQVAGESGIKQYVVERSTDGVNFTQVGTVTAKNSSSYSFTDEAPVSGNNFYRISSIGVSGDSKYSSIVKVALGGLQAGIAIYPNPVTGGKIGLQLTNQPAGNYGVRLLSITGQELYRNTVNYGGGSSVQTLNVSAKLAQGIYKLEVTTPDNNTYTQKLILK